MMLQCVVLAEGLQKGTRLEDRTLDLKHLNLTCVTFCMAWALPRLVRLRTQTHLVHLRLESLPLGSLSCKSSQASCTTKLNGVTYGYRLLLLPLLETHVLQRSSINFYCIYDHRYDLEFDFALQLGQVRHYTSIHWFPVSKVRSG